MELKGTRLEIGGALGQASVQPAQLCFGCGINCSNQQWLGYRLDPARARAARIAKLSVHALAPGTVDVRRPTGDGRRVEWCAIDASTRKSQGRGHGRNVGSAEVVQGAVRCYDLVPVAEGDCRHASVGGGRNPKAKDLKLLTRLYKGTQIHRC